MTELLIDRRASANCVSEFGTPLMLATQHNKSDDVVRLLLERGLSDILATRNETVWDDRVQSTSRHNQARNRPTVWKLLLLHRAERFQKDWLM